MQLEYIAGIVLDHFIATDDVTEPEPDFAAGLQAEKLSRRFFHEIILLDVQLTRKRHLTLAQLGSHGMIQRPHHFDLVLRIIGQYDFERPHDRHAALGGVTQVLPNAVLKQCHLNRVLFLGHANALAEIAQCRRRVATSAHAGQRSQARIVPTTDHAIFHELVQLALAGKRIGEIQPGEFVLPRPVFGSGLLKQPIIEVAMIFKFQRAQ